MSMSLADVLAIALRQSVIGDLTEGRIWVYRPLVLRVRGKQFTSRTRRRRANFETRLRQVTLTRVGDASR